MNKIIGIIGKKRSGKDTIAEELVKNYGYQRYGFADPIKRGAMEMFGFTEQQMYGTEEDKETVDERWGISPREMLKLLGTELLQFDIHKYTSDFHVGRGVWTYKFKYWYEEQLKTNPNLKVVISDVRFLHEEKILKEMGATLIRVVRPGITSTDTHSSEIEQENIQADVTLNNDKSIEDLHKMIEYLVYLGNIKQTKIQI